MFYNLDTSLTFEWKLENLIGSCFLFLNFLRDALQHVRKLILLTVYKKLVSNACQLTDQQREHDFEF